MRSLGIVRNLDQLGRLVIPKETRKAFNLNDGDPIEMFTDGDEIILKKYNPGCHCCGSLDHLTEVLGLKSCPKCLKEFAKAIDIIDEIGARKRVFNIQNQNVTKEEIYQIISDKYNVSLSKLFIRKLVNLIGLKKIKIR